MLSSAMPLVIRADASASMGTGHVMRCIAIGQAWQDLGGKVIFVSHNLPPFLCERLAAEHFELVPHCETPSSDSDAVFTADVAQSNAASAIIVDGYHFENAYRRNLRKRGLPVVAVDDFGAMTDADVIVNSNAYASLTDYVRSIERIEETPVILAGSQFALLRREFQMPGVHVPRAASSHLRILLSCGGSDPKNATEKILAELGRTGLSGFEVTAVVGGSFSRRESLETLVRALPFPVTVVSNCQDMPGLMRRMDLAITAGGSTCWEFACLGVPMMALITADNQIRVAKAVASFGAGWNLGPVESVNSQQLKKMLDAILEDSSRLTHAGQAGSELIDGFGARRVAEALISPDVSLHVATIDDSRMLWEWRNEETVRLASFNTAPISWEDHSRWFGGRLANSQSRILIAKNQDQCPVGQVRLDLKDARATISISIAEKFRAFGYGKTLIRKATILAVCHENMTAVDAFIRPENIASQKAFQKAGYRLNSTSDSHTEATQASQGLHFVFEPSRPATRAA